MEEAAELGNYLPLSFKSPKAGLRPKSSVKPTHFTNGRRGEYRPESRQGVSVSA